MFQIITVTDNAADSIEQLGTKPKFWYKGDDKKDYLFKESRPNTGEDWSEKIASELCGLLGLPHAVYDLAVWKGKRGVVSRMFVPAGGQLVHGNELLAKVVSEYPKTQFFYVRQYTLRRVLAIFRSDEQIKAPIGWDAFACVDSAIDVFIGYLMLDAWIGNQDRHHENWGLVNSPQLTRHLAPTYDHASSLGRNEIDQTRKERLKTRDRRRSMETYVERARSAFFATPASNRPMSTIDTFREGGKMRPGAAKSWLGNIERVSSQEVQLLFEKVPPERITAVAIEFALKMLDLNRRRLLPLKEEFR